MNSETCELTVIIPVLNEERTIDTILDRVLALPIDLEVIVVDDGSTDATPEILQRRTDSRLSVLRHPVNRGKGAAIHTAIPSIKGRFTVIQDGDLEYDPSDFHRMLEKVKSEEAQVVYGSRILGKQPMSYLRYWLGGRGITLFTNFLFGSHITDEPTCYKMIDSSLLKSLDLSCPGFEFCPELTGKILKRKIPIHEIPIHYHPRTLEQGKKIRWTDGLIALWTLLKIRLTGRVSFFQSSEPSDRLDI
ncbi:glycosyltransferase family 2 protein [bacterium]|nr:glycosyltransferase family 2 protein [candidate division CSSED10-310 bacterium]